MPNANRSDLIAPTAPIAANVRHIDNAVWLGHAYVTAQSYVDKVSSLAQQMKDDYRVLYWFVNVGKLDGSGRIIGGAAGLSQAVAFLNALNDWEATNGHRFNVLAWINGSLTASDADCLDVSDTIKRQSVVDECEKFVSSTVAGSYVTGAARAFDGIQIDFEPSGQDATRFEHLETLMEEIRGAFTPYPGKLTSFAAPKCGATNEWSWDPTFYYYMGRHVDFLAGMTYDTGLTSGTAYQQWMRDQTTGILRAVSGRFWNNDAEHPAPLNGVKVIIGFPAFPGSAYHDVAAEAIQYAAPGVDAGLAALESDRDPSRDYFGGAGVFLHTDGSGDDHYAKASTDWWWFGHDWLGAW
jgi:hypothetical protein